MNNKIEQLSVDVLIPYSNNARTHSDDQVTQIASSIKEFGFNNPILVDKNDGVIAGHGRLMAAKKLGLKQVPCIRLEHLTDAQRKAFILADNKIALNSGWDYDLLKVEIEGLSEIDYRLDLLGFDVNELNTIFPFISHQEYYEFAIELVIIMELIRIYLRLQVIDIQVDRLESLETRIMVDDLEVDEIRSEFLKVFLGESTLEWLLKIQSELKNSQIIFQSSLSEIEKEINEFEKIDVNYQTEINTRYMAINEKLSKTTEDYLSEAKNRLIEIEIFSKQGILNSKEKEAVNSFHKEIKAQLGSAENEYNEISHRFKSTIKHKIMKTS